MRSRPVSKRWYEWNLSRKLKCLLIREMLRKKLCEIENSQNEGVCIEVLDLLPEHCHSCRGDADDIWEFESFGSLEGLLDFRGSAIGIKWRESQSFFLLEGRIIYQECRGEAQQYWPWSFCPRSSAAWTCRRLCRASQRRQVCLGHHDGDKLPVRHGGW